MAKLVELKPVFVGTDNVRKFINMMGALEMARGEGRMGGVCSVPGRGKTRTAQHYAANNDCIYLRVATVWRSSELDFLQAMCREVGMQAMPRRKATCYRELVDRMLGTNRPVFIDEIQKLPRLFLDIVLDLSDATCCPFVMVGEPELRGVMEANKRVWSRTYRWLEFAPITESDVMDYITYATGLTPSHEVVSLLHKSSGGDFRLVRRDLISLVQAINQRGPDAAGRPQITAQMAKEACGRGLKGKELNVIGS